MNKANSSAEDKKRCFMDSIQSPIDWDAIAYKTSDDIHERKKAKSSPTSTLKKQKGTCEHCKNDKCMKYILGRYLLKRMINNPKPDAEWRDDKEYFAKLYHDAVELMNFQGNPKTYNPTYIEEADDGNDTEYEKLLPSCVEKVFYAFKRYCLKQTLNKDYDEMLNDFFLVYDPNEYLH